MKLFHIAFCSLLCLAFTPIWAQSKTWSLQECITYAHTNNITVHNAELDVQSSVFDVEAAWGSMLPSLSGTTSHSWNIGLNQNITTGLLENQTTQFTSAGVSSNVTIYNGLQLQNRLRRSMLAKISYQYQLNKLRDDVSLNVANAYLQIVFNKEALRVQKEQLSNSQKQLTKTQEMVSVGAIPKGDLLDAQATVATAKQKVTAAENALFISKISLAQLLQLKEYQNFDIRSVDISPKNSEVLLQTPQAIYEKAVQNRNEIKLAQTRLEMAEKDQKIALGGYQPSIIGFYNFSTRASNSDRVIRDANGNYSFTSALPLFDQFSINKGHVYGVQLNIPILNGLSARTNVQKSKVALKKSQWNLEQQKLDLERAIYAAFGDANGALKVYEAAQAGLEARQLSFQYAQEKFNVGLMNTFDLNQAQTLLVTAESDFLRAKYDYIFKVKILEFYFGIPIDAP
ncbi:MAG: transporter [Flavobacterium sp. BFFFF2]|nr:MAG: transporter [Flavobacterium sp. BFFFF2]